MASQEFKGFHRETITFFADLALNNNKRWFDGHKREYETHVLEPSRAFVTAMGERLPDLDRGFNAIPAVNGSLFRLNRDVRFSKDKSPYKTNLGIMFWVGEGKRMENPCLYFHLEDGLMLASGMYMFPKDMLDRYREAVVDDKSGGELAKLAGEMRRAGFDMGMEHYKRVPRGCDPDHPRADLLRYNGLTAMKTVRVPREFFSGKLVDYCLDRYRAMHKLNRWLLKYL